MSVCFKNLENWGLKKTPNPSQAIKNVEKRFFYMNFFKYTVHRVRRFNVSLGESKEKTLSCILKNPRSVM